MMQSNRPRNHRIAVLLTLTLLSLGGAHANAEARVNAELRGGYYTDVEEGFLGGGLNMSLGSHWDFNPNVEWVFVDGFDYVTANADFHRDLNPGGSGPAFWLGGGPALVLLDADAPPFFDTDGDETDLGLNLLGGVGAKTGSVRPFGQMKVLVSDNTETSFALGIRF